MTDTATEVEKAPEKPEDAPQAPEGQQEAPEGAPDPAEAAEQAPPPVTPQQPSEVAEETLGSKAVAIQTPAGSLTLRPNQKDLEPAQVQALVAIGIDTVNDPGVLPQVRPFMHMCQVRGLDPWAREAYLIGRGKGNARKYTMQTGIDGYRKMGAATGRFIRVKKRLWSAGDNDPEAWVQMTDEDGDVVRKRVWWEQWPAEKGNPGAAKVVIEHYDEQGGITTTAAVADWEMYAPYNDVWEGPSGSRRKKVGSDGKPVRELNDMWTKGGPHMLAKCAEALAYRMAFPARMSGFYVSEEMHRLDQQERDARAQAQAEARRAAFQRSQGAQQVQAPEPAQKRDEEPVDAEVVEEAPAPAATADTAPEVVQQMAADGDEAQRLLLGELTWQAEVLGQPVGALARRWVTRYRKNVEDFTAAELHPLVNGLRSMVAEAATKADLPEAAAYAQVAVDGAGPIDMDALGPEDEAAQADPDAPHLYVATEDGSCWKCGLAEDVGPHIESEGGDQS